MCVNNVTIIDPIYKGISINVHDRLQCKAREIMGLKWLCVHKVW